ncbi:hypothetical protein GCM10010174_73510 [Kutzneria viridogrisea]|uniref:Uncharacterized protein n=1 Tax=Kutzneria albida DSM 43870 TaxID=1449976 RepID=W5W9H0_9PSEU|nr:hypothetical protein KALB_4041 [Kutzneria albida DSM 43870]
MVPLGVFTAVFALAGLDGGLLAALGWSLAAISARLVRRRPVPAVLWLTSALLVVRTAVGLATGDLVLYFLQPTAQNFVIATVLLVSAWLRRPMLGKLAAEFCGLPAVLTGRPRVRLFFGRASVLWALIFLTNGAVTLWVLATAPIGQFLAVSTAGSYSLVLAGAAFSLLWFRRVLRRDGVRVRLGSAD